MAPVRSARADISAKMVTPKPWSLVDRYGALVDASSAPGSVTGASYGRTAGRLQNGRGLVMLHFTWETWREWSRTPLRAVAPLWAEADLQSADSASSAAASHASSAFSS